MCKIDLGVPLRRSSEPKCFIVNPQFWRRSPAVQKPACLHIKGSNASGDAQIAVAHWESKIAQRRHVTPLVRCMYLLGSSDQPATMNKGHCLPVQARPAHQEGFLPLSCCSPLAPPRKLKRAPAGWQGHCCRSSCRKPRRKQSHRRVVLCQHDAIWCAPAVAGCICTSMKSDHDALLSLDHAFADRHCTYHLVVIIMMTIRLCNFIAVKKI